MLPMCVCQIRKVQYVYCIEELDTSAHPKDPTSSTDIYFVVVNLTLLGNGNVNRLNSTACVLAATPMSFMEDGYYVPYHTTKPDYPATDCLVQP